MPAGHARYSAWKGQFIGQVPDAGQVLDALADGVLSDGVDTALARMLHQGMQTNETGNLPGLDALKDRIRMDQMEVSRNLLDRLDSNDLADAAASTTDDDVRRMLNALRAQSPVFPGLLNDASSGQRDELKGLISASAPAEASFEIAELLDRIVELTSLERQIRSVRDVRELDYLDFDLVQRLLGEHASDGFGRLAAGLQEFSESGYLTRAGSQTSLSARAVQHIGDALLKSTIANLRSRSHGEHTRHDTTNRHESAGTSRDYQFGDPFELDLGRTLLEAVKREPGAPVRFNTDDIKVIERESSERATTVLAIDLSRSMGERGYLLAAKKLALALSTYIRRRFPHDELLLIGFSESARPILLQELVDLRWDRYGFGTNLHDALHSANNILAAHRGRKRNLVLITDGEPTAHRDTSGKVVFSHPPSPETVAMTFREAARLRREGVYLCVCLLSATDRVSDFGHELARHAAGDVLITDPDNLNAELVERYTTRRR